MDKAKVVITPVRHHFLQTLQEIHSIFMWVDLISFKDRTSSNRTYALLVPLKDLLARDAFRSFADPWLKKPFTALSTSSTSMLGSMSEVTTLILGIRQHTDLLAPLASLRTKFSRPSTPLRHLGLTKRSWESVSINSWIVKPSSSGMTRFFCGGSRPLLLHFLQ